MAQQQMAGMKPRGMDDSDSESEDGMPPGLQGMPGLPPISGPVVTGHPQRIDSAATGTSEVSGQDEGPQADAGLAHVTGPEMASPRAQSPVSATDTQTGTDYTSMPPTVRIMTDAGEGFSVLPREATESQIVEVYIICPIIYEQNHICNSYKNYKTK